MFRVDSGSAGYVHVDGGSACVKYVARLTIRHQPKSR